jgi:hypothetical protein
MQLYTIEDTNNKCHEIILSNHSIFTSYESFVGLKHNDILILNENYIGYSATTGRHIHSIKQEYNYKLILTVEAETFTRYIRLLETDPARLETLISELETKAIFEEADLQSIKDNKTPSYSTIKSNRRETLKTRDKIIYCCVAELSGIQYNIIETVDKKERLISRKVKLDPYYKLLTRNQ